MVLTVKKPGYSGQKFMEESFPLIDRINKSKTKNIDDIKFLTKKEIKLRDQAEKKSLADIEWKKKRDAYLQQQLGRKQKENLFLGTKGKAKGIGGLGGASL